MVARGLRDVDDVPPDRRRDVDLARLLDHLGHARGVGDRSDVGERRAARVARQDLGLDLRRRVADRQPQHEPVELCLGQGVGALVFDRVLGRDDHERGPERVGLGVDRDLTLLHALEQGGLRLGGGTVDLVTQHDVGEDRARLELEVALLLVEDVDARDIGRQQVGGELEPAEGAVDRSSDGLGEHRLADTRYVFDQQVSFGDQRHEGESDLRVLAAHDLLDVGLDLAEALREALPILWSFPYFHDHLRRQTRQSYATSAAIGSRRGLTR